MTADNQSRVEPGTGPVPGVNCPARGSVTGRRRSWRGWAAAILSPDERPGRLTLPAPRDGLQLVQEAAAELRRAQIGVSDIGLRRPTLDDVFLQLTGAPPSQDGGGTSPPSRPALTVRGTEAAQSAGLVVIFPLVFASSVFVPVSTFP